jgi:hypothetical protein
MDNRNDTLKPFQEERLAEIRQTFRQLFSGSEYRGLADEIADYWESMLRAVWKAKSPLLKQKDERYSPGEPLSRIQQKTVVITYADSVRTQGEASLETLDKFLGKHFPAIGGMHMLPACQVVEKRFNDGFFSQVVRDRIHTAFGTNQKFAEMVAKYYSMADFVLNHVDIDNPVFRAYLDGDDAKGDCFYIFSEEEYRQRLKQGDFSQVFRPRPFPLFSIFRRKPADKTCAAMSRRERVSRMKALTGDKLPEPVIDLLSIFNNIKNDQMLLSDDYRRITVFKEYLKPDSSIDPDELFDVSATQETRCTPFILRDTIQTPEDLLRAVGYDRDTARKCAGIFRQYDSEIFGEEIRALTTFSHVQVDLNTATYQGLKMLADDFSWYLGLDLDMLRLDAANFAFKRWKTSCFGLPEVKGLMKIIYLSMDCVAPRIVANLEVNDRLSSVLAQMADKDAPPPMMYDFHLAGMLPVAFITENTGIFDRIFKKIAEYDIPPNSIRFSLAESHDGKSVRGSLDLLTLAERQSLADTVEKNGGRIKYKGVLRGKFPVSEFQAVCRESGIDFKSAKERVFKKSGAGDSVLVLDDDIRDVAGMATALGISPGRFTEDGPLKYFINKILDGREPYELCVATRDCLPKLSDPMLEVERYLAFWTLAFALMGRNVKSIYFNDLLGLPNDYERYRETGELRDLKRTKSSLAIIEKQLADTASIEHRIAKGVNNIIALVDSDPSLSFRGNEASGPLAAGDPPPPSVAMVRCSSDVHTLVIVNIGQGREEITINPVEFGLSRGQALFDNISGLTVEPDPAGTIAVILKPFQCFWLTSQKIEISPELLVR